MSDSDSESSQGGNGSSSDSEPETFPEPPIKKQKTSLKQTEGPKKPLSAYMFFCQKERPTLKADNPDASFGDLGRLLGEQWKRMSESEKAPYKNKAEKDKIRFANEGGNAARAAANAGKNGKAKKKVKKEGPKRPLSAFMFFSKAQRPKIKEQNPHMTFADLGREIGKAWKEIKDSDKVKYNRLADQDKQRYQNELAGASGAVAAAASDDGSDSGSDSGSESS